MNWKEKALAATRGRQLGAILAAATDTKIEAPYFTSKATVTSDGFVVADFTGADLRKHMGAFVGSSADLVRNTLGLADHLQLNDEERKELLTTVRNWIGTDYSTGYALKKLEVE